MKFGSMLGKFIKIYRVTVMELFYYAGILIDIFIVNEIFEEISFENELGDI